MASVAASTYFESTIGHFEPTLAWLAGRPVCRFDALTTQPMTPTYFRLLLRNLGLPQSAIEKALAREGLSPSAVSDSDRPITVGEQLGVFAELVKRAPARARGSTAGRRFHVGTHGSMGVAFMSARDVRQSLQILERFGPLRLPYVRSRTATRNAGRYVLAFDVTLSIDSATRVALMEMIAVTRKHLLESVVGEPITGVTFEFDYPAPPHAALYDEKLGMPVRFDRPRTSVTVPEALLDRECATADPAMFATAVEPLEKRERQRDSEQSVIAHVEDLMESAGDGGLSVEDVAQALGMSRRSLARRLHAAGTNFRIVRDQHRRGRAEVLLRDASLDVGEIAWRLGYRDVANFGRAARRWFGMSPRRYREQVE